MDRNELNQIIFNALETEHSHAKSEEYRKKVKEAIKIQKAVVSAMENSDNINVGPRNTH